jgi:hypothetical protein
MDDGQKTPCGHPNFNSYVKNLRVLVFMTDGPTDREINPVWAEKRIGSSRFRLIKIAEEH